MAIRLPTAQNVQTVDPAITRDIGLDAPAAAFGSAVGQEVEVFGEIGSQVAERELSRQEAIAAARARNEYNKRVQDEITRLSTEADFSDPKVMQDFGGFVTQTRQDLLGGAAMRPGTRAQLEAQLIDLSDRYTAQTAALAADAGLAAVETSIETAYQPLVRQAYMSPTSLPDLFQQANDVLALHAPALTPQQETTLRRGLQDRLANSAVEGRLAVGNVDGAEDLMAQFSGVMTGENQLQMQRRIDTFRFEQDQFQRKAMHLQQMLGRPLNQTEVLGLFGISPAAPSSEPLESVIGPNGQPVLVPRSQAAGMQPAPGTPMFSTEPTLAKLDATRVRQEIPAQRRAIQEQIDRNRLMQQLLATDTFETGDIPGALQQAVQETFNVDIGTPAGRQTFGAVASADVLARAQGMSGTLSDNDIRFLQSMAAGTFRGTEANKLLLEINEKLLEQQEKRLVLEQQYFSEAGNLSGAEDFVAKQMKAQGDIIDDEMKKKIAWAQLSTDQISKIPQQIANLFVGSVKVIDDSTAQALLQMDEAQLGGMPRAFLLQLESFLEQATGASDAN